MSDFWIMGQANVSELGKNRDEGPAIRGVGLDVFTVERSIRPTGP